MTPFWSHLVRFAPRFSGLWLVVDDIVWWSIHIFTHLTHPSQKQTHLASFFLLTFLLPPSRGFLLVLFSFSLFKIGLFLTSGKKASLINLNCFESCSPFYYYSLRNNKAKQIKNYCVFCVWVSDIIFSLNLTTLWLESQSFLFFPFVIHFLLLLIRFNYSPLSFVSLTLVYWQLKFNVQSMYALYRLTLITAVSLLFYWIISLLDPRFLLYTYLVYSFTHISTWSLECLTVYCFFKVFSIQRFLIFLSLEFVPLQLLFVRRSLSTWLVFTPPLI